LHRATKNVIGGGSGHTAAPKHVVHTTMSRRRLLSAFKKITKKVFAGVSVQGA
jgi:hypothetical protein